MHKNPVWLLFLIVIGLVTVWYTGSALLQLHRYFKLNTQTEAIDLSWSIQQQNEDNYTITGTYSFSVEKHQHQGSWINRQIYRNSWAAEKALEQHQAKKWTVWFDRADPEHSSLEKTFPTKACVSAAILLGLLVYFVGLGMYYTAHTSKIGYGLARKLPRSDDRN